MDNVAWKRKENSWDVVGKYGYYCGHEFFGTFALVANRGYII